ncbi:lytic transglycosylase domain-containing protein [Paraburkholderia sp. HD33-4]|uniref:lytic transglycosylase domain-containing protein n=1 Tax=Paraburkholderia sp. HD33-4 TaxID=2883242 RepID=UPI001F2198A0|nr:lytic transglycosylase domain-containing protein [Paraburkholderia sp. HD33-4]
MLSVDFNLLAQQCAPTVHPITLQAIVRTESGFNPYAIGIVGGHLVHQPHNRGEAVATAIALDARGINFSLGLGQINKANLTRYGLTYETVFDMCANLHASAEILSRCYATATETIRTGGRAMGAAISCYYSGNFTRGFVADFDGESYVHRVSANAQQADGQANVVPAIPVVMNRSLATKPSPPQPNQVRRATTSGVEEGSDPASRKHPSWDAFGDYACDGDSCE